MVGPLVRVVDALRELPVGEGGGEFIGRLTGIGGGAFGAADVEVVVDADNQLCTP
ncbi:MAG: hypothetical protein ABIY40_03300 [Rhodanobacteraceae bacterium]|nr:hypothetical protein [Pseudomonadota bacterium]